MVIKNKIICGITMGDPSGIGPEIILKSFEKAIIRNKNPIIIGDYNIMEASRKQLTFLNVILVRVF